MRGQSLEIFYRSLIETIGALVHAYESLLKFLIEEKEILVSSSLSKLKENNKKKENVLLHIQFLEERRKENIRDFSESLKIRRKNISFNDLILYFDDPEKRDHLKKIYVRFKNLVKDVKEKNTYNKGLVQSALRHSTGVLNEIKDLFYEVKTYKREGKIKKEGVSSGRVISREI